MSFSVSKAIIPAAGFGTRMLPFTKSVPKELIPLVDTPVLQYVIEEAVSSGAKEILVIVSEGKDALKNHFSPSPALEKRLADSGRTQLLDQILKINSLAKIEYICQEELDGLGGAVRLAKDFAAGEACMVLLGDTVMDSYSDVPAAGQLAEVYRKFGASVIALTKVAREKVSSYGIASGKIVAPGVMELDAIVEKPKPADAPGDLAVAARYLLTPGIFDMLAVTGKGVNGEYQLTDAIAALMTREKVYGCCINARRYDLGSTAGFVLANVEFALRRPELQAVLGRQIMNILKEKNISEQ